MNNISEERVHKYLLILKCKTIFRVEPDLCIILHILYTLDKSQAAAIWMKVWVIPGVSQCHSTSGPLAPVQEVSNQSWV